MRAAVARATAAGRTLTRAELLEAGGASLDQSQPVSTSLVQEVIDTFDGEIVPEPPPVRRLTDLFPKIETDHWM